LADYTGMR